jgi:anti-sigma factor RsiW
MSSCEQYQELISRLADGDLSQKEEKDLRAHMETCPDCAMLFQAFSAISRAVEEDLEDVPFDLRESVMAEIRREEIRKRNRLPNILRAVMSAAACVAVIVGVYLGVSLTRGNHLSTAAFQSNDALAEEKAVAAQAEAVEEKAAAPRLAAGDIMPAEEPELAEEAPRLFADNATVTASGEADEAAAVNAAPAEAADTGEAAENVPEADAPAEEETVQSAEPEVFELRDWSLSLLRTLLGGKASQRSPEELEGCLLYRIRLTAEKDLPEVPVYELDGVLYYLDPAEDTLYQADLTPEELDRFLHG